MDLRRSRHLRVKWRKETVRNSSPAHRSVMRKNNSIPERNMRELAGLLYPLWSGDRCEQVSPVAKEHRAIRLGETRCPVSRDDSQDRRVGGNRQRSRTRVNDVGSGDRRYPQQATGRRGSGQRRTKAIVVVLRTVFSCTTILNAENPLWSSQRKGCGPRDTLNCRGRAGKHPFTRI